ncbi:hypothetical protein [Cytobacillus depressus]|nr:hypothetical protein [Cytobacillus depressus]
MEMSVIGEITDTSEGNYMKNVRYQRYNGHFSDFIEAKCPSSEYLNE